MTDSSTGEPVSEHPPSETIAAYLNGSLAASDRSALETHLADCRSCRHEVTSARRLLARRQSRTRWVWIAPAAAAAALALILLNPGSRGARPGDEPMRAGEETGPEAPSSIRVHAPANGSTVGRGPVIFIWRSPVPQLRYHLTVTDGAGIALWTGETSDTTLTLPAEVRLDPDRTYFWHVDALGPDGRSLTTRNQRFSTAP